MNPLYLDSSFVIALLNRADVHHAKASALATELAAVNRGRVVTTATLSELGDGFARKKRWDLVALFFAATFEDFKVEIVPVDAALLERAISLRNARLDKDWGLTDCLSFIVMQDRGIEDALTADHHFQQAGFRALLLEP